MPLRYTPNIPDELAMLFDQTMLQLSRCERDAREGKNLLQVADFCKYLRNGRIIFLLHTFAGPGRDYSEAYTKVQDILYICGQQWQGLQVKPSYAKSDIAEILERLTALESAQNKSAKSYAA